LLSGCYNPPAESNSADLQRFGSADEFKQYVSDQVRAQGVRYATLNFESGALPAAAPATPSGASGGSDSASTTNVQEAGVDEADIVKNDTTFICVLGAKSFQIIQAVPADQMK